MGQALNYEIGRLNVGRRVRVMSKNGAPHGAAATLKGGNSKSAEVLFDGHGRTELVSWDLVRDWTSHNALPLAMPPKATGLGEVVRVSLGDNGRPLAAPIPKAEPAKPTLQEISERISACLSAIGAAEEEVDSALELLQQCKQKHADEVAKLKELRKHAADVLSQIDEHLVGTGGGA